MENKFILYHSLITLFITAPYPDPDPEAGEARHVEQASRLESQTTASFVAELEGFLLS